MKRWLVPILATFLVAAPHRCYGGVEAPGIEATGQAQGTGGTGFAASLSAPDARPVNPHATAEARALLREIDEISGHYTLTGQHNFPNHVSRWSDRVYDLTGKYPALFGEDFGFSGGEDKDSTEGRPSMIQEVERQYRKGAVIALCWHAVKPTEDEPVTFRDSVQGHLTNFEWNELLTPGTALNARWLAQTDVIAGYLKELQDAGVPVLFRPFHEMNGNWFWWGGRPGPHGSAQLYHMLYDRYVNYHHLNNLIWVWNVNSPGGNAGELAGYDPGHEFADIYAIDIYGEFKQDYYDQMLALAGNKPVALAEVGVMPTLEVIAKQPRWAYFMMWSGSAEGNPPELLQANFHAPNLLTLGDPPLAKYVPTSPSGRHFAEAVSHNATPQARALLNRLHDVSGSTPLSGQWNTQSNASMPPSDAPSATPPGAQPVVAPAVDAAAAATKQVFASTGKYPAIFGADLGADVGAADMGTADLAKSEAVRAAGASAAIAEAKRQHAANAIIVLRWTAPPPVEGLLDAKDHALTSFEWNELLTPGTDLNKRWSAQVDVVAVSLKKLQDAGIAVLWDPYPEANGKQHWWGGRPGIHGSSALYRMLFDRLVNQQHLGNLIWVWTAAPGGYGPDSNGAPSDYFPGLLYTGAVNFDMNRPDTRGRGYLTQLGGDKVIGVSFSSGVPEPSYFAGSRWAWFLLAPSSAASGASAEALKTLYSDPHIATRDPDHAAK
ncbi:MAG TPA: glycosyl hydrolase [Acidisarcina sp.]